MYVYIQVILLAVLPLIIFAQTTEPEECSEGTCIFNNTVANSGKLHIGSILK